MSAYRCSLEECTPPSESKPMRCSAAPGAFAASSAALITAFSRMEPSRHAILIRESSWCTMRPAPIFKWPTSEFPIWPAGRPTASPDASSLHMGASPKSASKYGVFAREIALPGPGSAKPKPSIITSRAGVRSVCIVPLSRAKARIILRPTGRDCLIPLAKIPATAKAPGFLLVFQRVVSNYSA